MSARKLATNTIFYSAALAGQKALSFVYFILLARALGVAGQGRFSFALSFTALFSMFMDLGLTQILIRETARNKRSTAKNLSLIIGYKLAVSAIVLAAIAIAINLLGYPALTKELVYVSGLVMLVDSLTLSVYGAIRGEQNLAIESFGTVGNQAIVLAFGGLMLYLGYSPVWVMSAYLVASLSNLLWSSWQLRRRFGVRISAKFDWKAIRTLLAVSFPFALAGIFSKIFASVDVVFLSKFAGDHAVGIYSAAFKVAFALQFVALAFSASIYPAFSSYWAHDRTNLAKLFTKSMFWLAFISAPLVCGVIAIADPVIPAVFGHAYAASILPLQILMASMLFVFLCFPIGALLNACDRQGRHTINLGITAAVSIVANLILIPIFSYNGAAVANLLSYLTLFILGITVVSSIVSYDAKYLFWSLAKICAASVLMALVVIAVKGSLHFVLAIACGVMVYGGLAYALKIFNIGAIIDFIHSVKPKAGAAIDPEA